MNQVWNIFRKDVRHHWPEIAASLALLVAFAWFDIRSWSHFDSWAAGATGLAAFFASEMLPSLIEPLLLLSWVFLIVRVIQEESLVGDRQFWVTLALRVEAVARGQGAFRTGFHQFSSPLHRLYPSRARRFSSNSLCRRATVDAIAVDSRPIRLDRRVSQRHQKHPADALGRAARDALSDRHFCAFINDPEVELLRKL